MPNKLISVNQYRQDWINKIPRSGCVGLYDPKTAINESRSFKDVSGFNNHLSASSYPTYDPGHGWVFDGTQWLNTGIVVDRLYTVTVVFSECINDAGRFAFSNTNSTSWGGFFHMPNRYSSTRVNTGGMYKTIPDYSGLSEGVVSLTNNKYYLNGVLKYDEVTTGTIDMDDVMCIGGGPGGSYLFIGVIHAFVIHNRELSSEEVEVLHSKSPQP